MTSFLQVMIATAGSPAGIKSHLFRVDDIEVAEAASGNAVIVKTSRNPFNFEGTVSIDTWETVAAVVARLGTLNSTTFVALVSSDDRDVADSAKEAAD